MPINIVCPQCQARHQVADQMAGQQARCRCGHVLSIPASPSQATPPRPAAAPASGTAARPGAVISFQCPKCKRLHQAQPQLAGSAARCSCGTVVRVPGAPAAAAAGGTAAPPSNLGGLLDQLTPDDWERARGTPKVDEKEKKHSSEADVLKRHLLPESKSSSIKRSGERPVGLMILSVLHFLGAAGCAVLAVLVIAAAELARRFLEQVNLPVGAVVLFAALLGALAAFNVLVGVALLMRQPWGWWVGTFAYAMNMVDRVITAIANVVDAAGSGEEAARVAGTITGSLVSIAIGFWLLSYFFKPHIRQYFKMDMPLKTAAPIAVGSGAAAGVLLAILGLVIGSSFEVEAEAPPEAGQAVVAPPQ